MIGGHDISFPAQPAAERMEGMIRLVVNSWREAIVENAETGEQLDGRFVGFQPIPREVLVYRNSAAREAWVRDGAGTLENANSMLHFVCGSDSITLVLDDRHDVAIQELLSDVHNLAYQDIFWMRGTAA